MTEPFRILEPSYDAVPMVVGIPHTGTVLPDGIIERLQPAMRSQPMCDWHLHELYAALPGFGVTVVHAVYSRFISDLNRPPDSAPLYPGRFETGLVPMRTFQGEEVWITPPDADEIAAWRERYHAPYHVALAGVLDAAVAEFGRVYFLDLHSVVSSASELHSELTGEIYLGDRDGTSNDGAFTALVERGFASRGFRVVRNAPYKGGYNTAHYGARPEIEALQIEMCQRCYMDEADPAGGPAHQRFGNMQADIAGIFSELVSAVARGTTE